MLGERVILPNFKSALGGKEASSLPDLYRLAFSEKSSENQKKVQKALFYKMDTT